jgi:hypothetical protein
VQHDMYVESHRLRNSIAAHTTCADVEGCVVVIVRLE